MPMKSRLCRKIFNGRWKKKGSNVAGKEVRISLFLYESKEKSLADEAIMHSGM